ncbi:hypothetical protein TNCV_4041431 [Trichonephila clavipes]|nr:hypothetical protein TNCV_4041431 [Trichonephila clavipes]
MRSRFCEWQHSGPRGYSYSDRNSKFSNGNTHFSPTQKCSAHAKTLNSVKRYRYVYKRTCYANTKKSSENSANKTRSGRTHNLHMTESRYQSQNAGRQIFSVGNLKYQAVCEVVIQNSHMPTMGGFFLGKFARIDQTLLPKWDERCGSLACITAIIDNDAAQVLCKLCVI